MREHVRSALEARLATVSGIPPAATHWAKENDAFDPPVGEQWLRSRLAPGNPQLLTMPARGGWREVPGAWRLLLHFPLDTGTSAADVLAPAVVDHFPKGLTLTAGGVTIRIDGARDWAGGRDIEDGWYTVPVDVTWHVWALNTLP